MDKRLLKLICRIVLGVGMVPIGAQHFMTPDPFIRIVPSFLPYPEALVFLSGLIEVLAGVGLLMPQLSQKAAWVLVVLYIAVFPANLNQAIHNIPVPALPHDPPLVWLRLPFQAFLVTWAWWLTRADDINQVPIAQQEGDSQV